MNFPAIELQAADLADFEYIAYDKCEFVTSHVGAAVHLLDRDDNSVRLKTNQIFCRQDLKDLIKFLKLVKKSLPK